MRLGFATTTCDRAGDPLGPPAPVPADLEARLRNALDARLGTQPQTPPAYRPRRLAASALTGWRAAARRGAGAGHGDAEGVDAGRARGRPATIDLHTSAGYYVRSLAHDVGAALGCGGHLAALQRTASGRFTIEGAAPLPHRTRRPRP